MPPPRSPSYIEPLSFPVFALAWYADPTTGDSITAYSGGGGSARTGVFNQICVQSGLSETTRISTDNHVGVACQLYRSSSSSRVWLLVAMANEIRRYDPRTGELCGTFVVGAAPVEGDKLHETCNAISVNAVGNLLAVGFENGVVKVFGLTDEEGIAASRPLAVFHDHTNTVCALDFAPRSNRLISSAKDGMAFIYDGGALVARFKCSVLEDGEPEPKRPPQVLVRGCAFCDFDGKVALTVASARKGKAFLARWIQQEGKPPAFACADRIPCSDCPVSAMSISQDGTLLALGSVSGSISLWSTEDLRMLKQFKEVHELPVTSIAARPFAVPVLDGEDDTGVQVHARSVSADNQMACLTLQKRAPKKSTSGSEAGTSVLAFMKLINRVILALLLAWIFSPVYHEANAICSGRMSWRCIMDEVIVAPISRPGVSVPPY